MASTTWYVNGVHGSDSNNCKSAQAACKTIHHAIALASSEDSIMVAAATYSENLTISKSLKISGSGAATTIIDGGGVNSVVTISATTATVVLSQLTIRNGSAFNGGGVKNFNGTLTINNSTVSGNVATGGGCSRLPPLCYGGKGGGIYSSDTVTINDSTVSGNVAEMPRGLATPSYGGGIYSSGTLTINNSTVSGNAASRKSQGLAPPFGGGISSTSGTLTISNSTISGNYALVGGGIATSGAVKIQNSIVANNTEGNGPGNCSLEPGGTMTSHGYNLSSDNTCNFSSSGDRNNINPKLGTLGNYGGPTQTIPLLSESPAIDAGNPSGCTDGQGHLLTTDQRGMRRPDSEDKKGCDMGAFEKQNG
jgi:hypothetical protein